MLSELIKKFDKSDDEVGGKRVLTKEQADVFKGVIGNYTSGGIGVLNASSGTGKGVCISAIKKYCDSKGISCDLTALSGKASSAMGGNTIHSYIGLSMKENNEAKIVDDVLLLQRNMEKEIELPSILIIDEFSQCGQKLLKEILSVGFNYILFVGDTQQLPPVKDKAVEWDEVANYYYTLTKTMRTKDPHLSKVFDDFKLQKLGELSNLNIFDYENGSSIVSIDYEDMDKIPPNADVTFVGYRNKLVDFMASKLTHPRHDMYNLNIGVNVTALEVEKDKKTHAPMVQANGYFKRNFVSKRAYYNGEDVQIITLDAIIERLVSDGSAKYGKWYLKRTVKGIMITNSEAEKGFLDKESIEDKYFLSFPENDVLDYCSLAVIESNTFVFIWNETQDIYNEMIQYYFEQLLPHLKPYQTVQGYYRGKNVDLSILNYQTRDKIQEHSKLKYFMEWYESTNDNLQRKEAWRKLLQAKSVVTVRPTTSRTITKAQGISTNVLLLCEDSFYGASDNGKYVGVSRAKNGIILIKNMPDWK